MPRETQTGIRLFNPAPPGPNPSALGFDSIASFLERSGTQKPGAGALWAKDFQLHEVNITIHYFFWHDILESLRKVEIRAEIRGEARIVPEPIALPALSLGLILVCVVARTRNGR
jgi:hypothetical protein